MKVSDLIIELQGVLEEHGDIDVQCVKPDSSSEYGDSPYTDDIEEVNVETIKKFSGNLKRAVIT